MKDVWFGLLMLSYTQRNVRGFNLNCWSNMWRWTRRGKKTKWRTSAPTKLTLAAKTAEGARNPLICIPLGLKAECKIQPDFSGASHSSIKTSDIRMEGPPRQKWLTSARLGSQPKTQAEEELIIFMDNGYCFCVAENFLHRFFFLHPCQLIFSAAYITLMKLDQTFTCSNSFTWLISAGLSTREALKYEFPTLLITKHHLQCAYRQMYNPPRLSAVVVFLLARDKHMPGRAVMAMDLRMRDYRVYGRINPFMKMKHAQFFTDTTRRAQDSEPFTSIFSDKVQLWLGNIFKLIPQYRWE